MLVARLTAPGVADVYQGTEAFRDLLVDPDNRVPPDHAALDALVERAATMDGRAAWAEPERAAAAQGGRAGPAAAAASTPPTATPRCRAGRSCWRSPALDSTGRRGS